MSNLPAFRPQDPHHHAALGVVETGRNSPRATSLCLLGRRGAQDMAGRHPVPSWRRTGVGSVRTGVGGCLRSGFAAVSVGLAIFGLGLFG
ncbi:MAG: hypothetical protein ACKOJF_32015, partial [Planctomycetaceae bacterium]